MAANETTALILGDKKTATLNNTINLLEEGNGFNRWRSCWFRGSQITVLESESKFLVLATAMIAIVLFVIIVEISITALKIPDLVFRQGDNH